MLDGPAHYPLNSSSAQLHQQELQLRQYTLAAMSARERDRERVRLSPEPHLEIMRPVSPFQNKRPLAHQQAQTQAAPQTQPQREQRIWNPHYQVHSNSQPYTHARPFHAQEASQSSTSTTSNSYRTAQSNSRARQHAHKGDSRGTRATQRDGDISPALKMMNYDTSFSPPSSDQNHERVAADALAPPERSDMNRSTSPEGGRKRNPGWRKPVPKYIPTPPSTPPTATFERLPSSRGREEHVPPMPPPSASALNAQTTRAHPPPAKAYSQPAPSSVSRAPPARPARAATDHQVPVMFRDLTASRTRMATIQPPAQVHTRQNVHNRTAKASTGPTQSVPDTTPPPRSQTSTVSHAQQPAAPRAPPQAHTAHQDRMPQPAVVTQSDSINSQRPEDRTETRRGALLHPQPKKVPSMAQLVAMVLPSRSPSRSPSRTPSPGIPVTTKEISGPLSLNSVPPGMPSFSVNPPSPIAAMEAVNTVPLSAALLQPEQVYLPPSGNTSARSSRSISPQPSPRRATSPLPTSSRTVSPRASPRSATAPLPVRSRSRSPTPAAVPQYAPPGPRFPPPPPNNPIAVPKPSVSTFLQPLLNSRLADKAEATVAQVQVSRVVTTQAISESPSEYVVPYSTRKPSPPSGGVSSPPTAQVVKDTKMPTEPRNESVVVQDPKPSSQDTDDSRSKAVQGVTVSRTERHSPVPVYEGEQPSQVPEPAWKEESRVADVSTKGQAFVASTREYAPPSRDLNRMKSHARETKDVPVGNVAVAAAPREQLPPSRNLRQEAPTPVERVADLEGNIRSSPTSIRDYDARSSRPLEAHVAAVQVSSEVDNSVVKRRAPAPKSDRAQVSRESGLVTPPITPPGTLASKTKDENHRTKDEGCSSVEQASATRIEHIAQSTSPAEPPINEPRVPKTIMRREALIQDDERLLNDEPAVHDAKNDARPTMPTFALGQPASTIDVFHKETPMPPLPADWKDTITRVAHPDTTRSPSPSVPSRLHVVEKSDMLSSVVPTAFSRSEAVKPTDAAPASRYVIRAAPTEQVEHATMALELHVHEVETRRIFETTQTPDRKVINGEKDLNLLSSRSPRRKPAALELVPKPTPSGKHQPTHDFSPPSVPVGLAPTEVPIRNRSPVPRRIAPQQYDELNCVTQERTDAASSITTTEEANVSSSIAPIPPARQPAEASSRSHSSGSKRKGKSTRARPDGDGRNASKVRLDERALEDSGVSRYRDAETPAFNEPAAPLPESSTSGLSPPPRYQSLGSRKRLPPNGSESNLSDTGERSLAQDGPSSPPAASRPLPPPSQTQTPSRPQRHLHGHHKRLPAPEVTQQAYRPPTPPIPSHYRKKRSNDPLPAEPATFMKPAVHVIYPDTSTSHGPSLSGDSVFNMSSPKPSNNNNRVLPAVTSDSVRAYREDRARPQSPSLSNPASQEDEYEYDEPEAYPQVPPKGRRPEVNAYGSPSASDRLSDFTIQHATRGQVRYPSAPVGQAKAHILMLPPSSNNSKSRIGEPQEVFPDSNVRPRRIQQPRAKKAARSQSEKVLRNNDNVRPVARSRSTPIPTSRQRSKRGFWRIFGLWARVFMAKFKTWASPTPSPSHSSEYGGYYDTY